MQLAQNYNEKPDIITDMVIGMSDGFMIPLALTTGLYSAGLASDMIIYSGLIIAVVGAVAMAIGRYLSAREDAAHHHEMATGGHDDDALLEHVGISAETRALISSESEKDRQQWMDMMAANDLSPEAFNGAYSRKSGLYIGLSYVVAGLVPVLPFIVIADLATAWMYSAGVTVFLLLVFGYFKGKATAVNPLAGALRVALTGIVAAMAAFYLGGLFA
ncbi:MAG: hypothetical protein EOP56_16680 [Sphingobacteriales bacterium]|nr:MAG: hypothetical protein EOP56_16680 [Sphingobacteriales bacterium]